MHLNRCTILLLAVLSLASCANPLAPTAQPPMATPTPTLVRSISTSAPSPTPMPSPTAPLVWEVRTRTTSTSPDRRWLAKLTVASALHSDQKVVTLTLTNSSQAIEWMVEETQASAFDYQLAWPFHWARDGQSF